jgi:4-hydroxy-3-methylbut-2-enyl diphosphate reductase
VVIRQNDPGDRPAEGGSIPWYTPRTFPMLPSAHIEPLYFQKGFGLKAKVGPALARAYQSAIVERLKEAGYDAVAGDVRLKLAREFGFCYGVDRAVEYAYETRSRFPDKRLFLSGEIIHNPAVNDRVQNMGIRILPHATDPVVHYAEVEKGDVVILPAFGVTVGEMEHLAAKECILVDTTCGSVLNVWKMVHRCARDGYTVVIHGKHRHEEMRATASQTRLHAGGRYLCVRDAKEAAVVCAFIRQEVTAERLLAQFSEAATPGFDPARDLERIGLANQTTMLMSESFEIQEMLRSAVRDRHGEAALAHRFRAFDTICSATQERQDAVEAILREGGIDLMIVIGGYNSSNTQALAGMCAPRLPTFHIDGPGCLDADAIRHRPLSGGSEVTAQSWLPSGKIAIGLTAGASTPDSVVGDVVERILNLRGHTAADLAGPATIEGQSATCV